MYIKNNAIEALIIFPRTHYEVETNETQGQALITKGERESLTVIIQSKLFISIKPIRFRAPILDCPKREAVVFYTVVNIAFSHDRRKIQFPLL